VQFQWSGFVLFLHSGQGIIIKVMGGDSVSGNPHKIFVNRRLMCGFNYAGPGLPTRSAFFGRDVHRMLYIMSASCEMTGNSTGPLSFVCHSLTIFLGKTWHVQNGGLSRTCDMFTVFISAQCKPSSVHCITVLENIALWGSWSCKTYWLSHVLYIVYCLASLWSNLMRQLRTIPD